MLLLHKNDKEYFVTRCLFLEHKCMRIIAKIKNRAAFSLTELLAAILILGMVSTVVAGGIPVARDAYNKITVSANAQVLLSTTISALRGQLGAATIDKDVDAGDTLVFFSGKNGSSSKIDKSGADGEMQIHEFWEYSDPASPYYNSSLAVPARPLMSGTDGLYATYTKIGYRKYTGLVTVTGLTVKKEGKEKVTPVNVSIRIIGS